MESTYQLGGERDKYLGGKEKSITFVVTEECNLRCKYCYMTGKNNRSIMSFDIARKAVDYALENFKDEPGVIWDFIGGEPLLEIELIDKICDYVKKKMYFENHHWFNNYTIGITTNGILYSKPKVQEFIKKNQNRLSVTFSIDGNKKKHDLQRVKPDGSGSYDDVVKNVPLWLEQIPEATTKVTFASGDLKYLKDSIIHLWELGIKNVMANVVYEDVWNEGDDEIFEEQMKSLADYIIENKLWNKYDCGLFDDSIGYALTGNRMKDNWCAAGKMLAVDHNGVFYPCTRYLSFCLENRDPYIIGNVDKGINEDLIRPFLALNIPSQSPEKCLDCQVAAGCGWCQAFNYDQADSDTHYQRATYICKMHKARCRANEYYWSKLEREQGVKRRLKGQRTKMLYILTGDDAVYYCNYSTETKGNDRIKYDDFKAGIEYAKENFWMPVIVHNNKKLPSEFEDLFADIEVMNIQPAEASFKYNSSIIVYNNNVDRTVEADNSILLVNNNNISKILEMSKEIFLHTKRINLILQEGDQFKDNHFVQYAEALDKTAEIILEYLKNNVLKEINVLTDRLVLKDMSNCNSGVDNLTLAPDGNLYICPAFYYDEEFENTLDNFSNGFEIANKQLLKIDKSPICLECDAFQCKRCVYQNKLGTTEYNTPTSNQCRISHLEREKSYQLQQKLIQEKINNIYTAHEIKSINYDDPLELLIG